MYIDKVDKVGMIKNKLQMKKYLKATNHKKSKGTVLKYREVKFCPKE